MEADGLDYFGAESAESEGVLSLGARFARATAPLSIGAVSALLMRRSHPLLTFLGVSALVGNTQAVLRGDRSLKEAALRMGRHAVATAGSLAMPVHPAVGYVAGAFAGDLLFDGRGSGIIDEWSRYVGVDMESKIKPDDKTKALVAHEGPR